MELDYNLETKIDDVLRSDERDFAVLVRLAGMDPLRDLQGADLSGADFTATDLSTLNLDLADLRNVKWPSFSAPFSCRFSLNGQVTNFVRGDDFQAISTQALKERLWKDRFFSFALLVDSFGETVQVLSVLKDIIGHDKSTYMPLTASLYMISAYLRDSQAKEYCRSFADAGNAYSNIYKASKIRRMLSERATALARFNIVKRFPSEVTPIELRAATTALLFSDSDY